MRKIVFCEFNMDTACVELRLEDGTLLSIDCTAVENEVANSMYQRAIHDLLCPEIGHLEQAKKRSQNAQPQNEILCSKGLGGVALNKQFVANG